MHAADGDEDAHAGERGERGGEAPGDIRKRPHRQQSQHPTHLAGARIGILICNDRLYPEPSRVLARRGAEIIFMPICYSTYGDSAHRMSIWEVPLRSRAFENGVFVATANRFGTKSVRVHVGRMGASRCTCDTGRDGRDPWIDC